MTTLTIDRDLFDLLSGLREPVLARLHEGQTIITTAPIEWTDREKRTGRTLFLIPRRCDPDAVEVFEGLQFVGRWPFSQIHVLEGDTITFHWDGEDE